METNPRKYCEDMLPLVSRTFALGISLLEEPLFIQVGVGYLICRITDTLEDTSEVATSIRYHLLKQTAQSLCSSKREDLLKEIKIAFPLDRFSHAEYDLLHNTHQVMTIFDTFPSQVKEYIQACVWEMANGMADTVNREENGKLNCLRDYDDLRQYCYYVAGTVGKLLTRLFAHNRPSINEEVRKSLEQREIDFGLGLQLTNILKGIYDDHKRGVVYLPRTLLQEQRLTKESLFSDPERSSPIIFSLANFIVPYLDRAIEYTLLIPPSERDIRLFCALPVLFALRTLKIALEYPAKVLNGEPLKITRKEVKELHIEADKRISENDRLAKLFEKERRLAI